MENSTSRQHGARSVWRNGAAFLGAAILLCLVTTSLHPRSDRPPNDDSPPPWLFSFGVVADIHAANKDTLDIPSRRPRYFRGAVDKTGEAADMWRDREGVQFVLQLGDAVDASNAPVGMTEWALDQLRAQLSNKLSVWSVVGNHDLANWQKQRWAEEMPRGSVAAGPAETVLARSFFSFSHGGFRFVGLDAFDEDDNAIEATTSSSSTASADAAAAAVASNAAAAAAAAAASSALNVDFGLGDRGGADSAAATAAAAAAGTAAAAATAATAVAATAGTGAGAASTQPQCLGAIGARQLEWLEGEIEEAADEGQRVIVFSHLPILPRSAANCVLRHSAEVLDILHGEFLGESPLNAAGAATAGATAGGGVGGSGANGGGVVALVVSGAHRHAGWYTADSHGLHHLAVNGLVGSGPGGPPVVATAHVFADRLELAGAALAATVPRVLPLPSRRGELAAGGQSHGMEVLG